MRKGAIFGMIAAPSVWCKFMKGLRRGGDEKGG